jgi:hypothetical protein
MSENSYPYHYLTNVGEKFVETYYKNMDKSRSVNKKINKKLKGIRSFL